MYPTIPPCSTVSAGVALVISWAKITPRDGSKAKGTISPLLAALRAAADCTKRASGCQANSYNLLSIAL